MPGLFNTHVDLNPFNGSFDPTPFLNLGVTSHVKQTIPTFNATLSGSNGLTQTVGTSTGDSSTNSPQQVSKNTGANTGQNGNTTTTGGGSTYGGGTSSADSAAYGTYANEANDYLSRLLGSYNQTKQSLNSNYDIKGNQLNSARDHAQHNYQDAVTQTNQDLVRQDNQVRQGVHSAYQNLMNLLGAYGGGGTSVAQQWAPTAAQHFQNAQLGDANQNAATNLRSLNTNWGNYQEDWKNQQQQLADTRAQDLANADSQYNTTRSKLSTILDRINARAVSPSDIAAALSGVDVPNVNFVKPSYTGTTPVYNAPNLSTFEAQTPVSSFASPASTSNSAAAPALAYLLNQQKRQQPNLA